MIFFKENNDKSKEVPAFPTDDGGIEAVEYGFETIHPCICALDFPLYRYVDSVGYDCHGQRVRLVYGNGTETRYAYDLNRRLSRLKVTSASGTVMDDSYTFDAVGNVTGIRNQAGATAQGPSAVMEHSYGYDGLYRLVSATGSYSRPSATASYSVGMSYDDMGRITSRSQHAVQDGAVRPGYLCSGYELAYSYGQEPGNRFKLGTVTDSHHRVVGTGTPLGMLEDTHSYGYDADGNLTYVSTARMQADGTERGGVRERRLLWDAEGRMRASDDGGYVTAYVYDADGNRTVKQSGCSAHLYVNSAAQSGVTSTRGFTLYVGPWMTAGEAGRYTKHFYAGDERVASKVGNVADYRGDELTGPRAGDDMGGVTVDYAAKYAALTARIAEMYAELGVPYAGTDNDRNGALLSRTARQGATGASESSQVDGTEADGLTSDGGSSPEAAPVRGEEETMRFFYHPDHLGSASYVTDRDGALVQHLEYAPFGEVFLDERGSGEWSSPYLFNAKELDPETGLYYYGARYYDPRLAMWISPDPLGELMPQMTPYKFSNNNPLRFIDFNGLFETEEEAKKVSRQMNNAPVLQHMLSGEWFLSLNEFGNDAYTSGTVVKRFFGGDSPFRNTCLFISGSAFSYWNTTMQQNSTPDIWKSHRNLYGVSGQELGDVSGMRSIGRSIYNNMDKISNGITTFSILSTTSDFLGDMDKGPGPNMRNYLTIKFTRDQLFNCAGAYGTTGVAASFGYNLGYFIEDVGKWMTGNPDFRIRYNPYTHDFTPIEITLQKYDELGIFLY